MGCRIKDPVSNLEGAGGELRMDDRASSNNSNRHFEKKHADWQDNPLIANMPLAVGAGALRGAAMGGAIGLIHDAMFPEHNPDKHHMSLSARIGIGAGIGAVSGAALHYTPEIARYVHPEAKVAHFMDYVSAPLWVKPGPLGVALGGVYGAAAGAGMAGAQKLKRRVMGEPEQNIDVGQSALSGAAAGVGISSLSQMMGQNKFALYSREWGLGAQIVNDPMIPSWRQAELIRDLDRAHSMGISITPQQLISAGFVGLASWLVSKGLGAGAFGQTVAGLGGAMLGAALNAPGSTTIYGDGFYRP